MSTTLLLGVLLTNTRLHDQRTPLRPNKIRVVIYQSPLRSRILDSRTSYQVGWAISGHLSLACLPRTTKSPFGNIRSLRKHRGLAKGGGYSYLSQRRILQNNSGGATSLSLLSPTVSKRGYAELPSKTVKGRLDRRRPIGPAKATRPSVNSLSWTICGTHVKTCQAYLLHDGRRLRLRRNPRLHLKSQSSQDFSHHVGQMLNPKATSGERSNRKY